MKYLSFTILVFMTICVNIKAQKLNSKYPANVFTVNHPYTNKMHFHRFIPKHNGTIAYDYNGHKIKLNVTDTMTASFIEDGKWDSKQGIWIEGFPRNLGTSYVLLKDMTDVESGTKVIEEAAYEKQQKEQKEEFKRTFITEFIPSVIGIVVLIIVIIMIIGYRTRCPKCKSKFARRLINTQELVRESYTYRGSETGTGWAKGTLVTVSVPVTKTGTKINYQKTYKCKKCGYHWNILEVRKYR